MTDEERERQEQEQREAEEAAELTEAELHEPLVEEYEFPLMSEAAIKPLALPDGKLFSDKGTAIGVVMRPCVSRGRRIRNLPPIYTPRMLGEHASVPTGWPMFVDHAPARVNEALREMEGRIREALPPQIVQLAEAAKRGVRDIGGQVLRTWYDPTYVGEDDEEFGYQPSAILAEYYAVPWIREVGDENPNLFHTSISAWPTSGRPGTAPWDSTKKGMFIEGIRRKPAGSWDFVVRGGAGGKIQADDEDLMVCVAESVYAPRGVKVDLADIKADELRGKLLKDFPQLAEALGVEEEKDPKRKADDTPAPAAGAITEADVQRMIEEATEKGKAEGKSDDEIAEEVRDTADELLQEREEQRELAAAAHELIESAEGLTKTWKADLKKTFAMKPGGPTPTIAAICEAAEDSDDKDATTLLRERVEASIDHCRDLIAEAAGKPRVRNEGGAKTERRGKKDEVPLWRERFAEMDIVPSEAQALAVIGEEYVPEDARPKKDDD